MQIQSDYLHRNSETEFQAQLRTYINSSAGIIHVRTDEITRTLHTIRVQLLAHKYLYKEWDVVNGFKEYTLPTIYSDVDGGDGNIDFNSAFSLPLAAARSEGIESPQCFIYINAGQFIDSNPVATQLILQYSHILPATDVLIILVTPDKPLPENVPLSLGTIDFKPPGLLELKEILKNLLTVQKDKTEFNEEELTKICHVGAGMTKHNFESYCALAMTESRNKNGVTTVEDLISGISIGKTNIVNQNDILELYQSTDMANVGGLENVKDWVKKRANCYSDEAKEFGVEPPKGFVLVGIPGTGKSLVAQAVSGVLGIPLVRLDFGRVFNSLVGASEQRMRTALNMIESMSPIVVLADEVDKGLGGIGGSGDSGVSTRVLGTFLTWMQECKAPVMVIMTANNVVGLPAELLRRGRFDAIFSTSLPSAKELREVLNIHLRKRKYDIKKFPAVEVDRLVLHAADKGYLPAEIESAIKDGLVEAFSKKEELSMEYINKALTEMVPLSKAFAAKIAEMGLWGKENATPASKPDVIETTSAPRARQINRKVH